MPMLTEGKDISSVDVGIFYNGGKYGTGFYKRTILFN